LTLYAHRMLFVRHGETDYNKQGRLQGQKDIPLNGKGREQAAAVGRSLRKLMAPELASLDAAGAFVASPLRRTRETMEIAREAMGLPPQLYRQSAQLKELTFGDWEGLTWTEVEEREPVGAAARESDKWNYCPPRGESYAMLADRLRFWLAEQTRDLFVVSHGGVARALMTLIADLDMDIAAGVNIHQGRAIWFEDGRYRWVG